MRTMVRPFCPSQASDNHSMTDVVLIDLPTQRPESYAFSVPLTSIYSLVLYPPSFSSWRTYDVPANLL